MKRLLLTFFAVVSLSMLLVSAGITVNSPKTGDVAYSGESFLIKWNKGVSTDPKVKINIFRNSIVTTNFIKQEIGPNSGQFKWDVPASFTEGNYVLRIKSFDGKYAGDSGVFSVKKRIPDPPGSGSGILLLKDRTGGTLTIKDPIPSMTVLKGIKPSMGPEVEYFRLVNDRSYYGYQETLEYKFKNCEKVKIFDPYNNVIFNWAGSATEIKTGLVNVVFPSEKSTYSIEAVNKNSAYYGKAFGTIRPSADSFKITNGNWKPTGSGLFGSGAKIEFSYAFSGAREAYIKKFNFMTKVWDRVVKIDNPGFFSKSGKYSVTHDGKEGKYILAVIGDEVVTSSEVQVR